MRLPGRRRVHPAYGDHLAMLALTAALSGPADSGRLAWHPDRHGISQAGDIAGDIQAGDGWDVRLVCDEKPGSMITVTFSPVAYPEGEYDVQRQVEWMVCTDPSDPGSTEAWSRDDCDDMSPAVIRSAEEAGREAREHAEYVHANPDLYAGWDGEPWQ